MTQLKTLKDLTRPIINERVIAEADLWSGELRQEAINWVKNYRSRDHPPQAKEDIETLRYSEGIRDGTIHWIKHFFNITEEELK